MGRTALPDSRSTTPCESCNPRETTEELDFSARGAQKMRCLENNMDKLGVLIKTVKVNVA